MLLFSVWPSASVLLQQHDLRFERIFPNVELDVKIFRIQWNHNYSLGLTFMDMFRHLHP